jgi:hypothetical protein
LDLAQPLVDGPATGLQAVLNLLGEGLKPDFLGLGLVVGDRPNGDQFCIDGLESLTKAL